METFELRGVPGSFRIIRRGWDGYDRPGYTTLAKLTDDEAAALTKCRYLSEPYRDAEKPVAEVVIDPATLLSVQDVDLTPSMIVKSDGQLDLDIDVAEFYANCGPGVDPIPMIRQRLILTLPALTEPFQRTLTKLVDPWWFQQHTPTTRHQNEWLDQFRPSTGFSEAEKEELLAIMAENTDKAQAARAEFSTGVHPRVLELKAQAATEWPDNPVESGSIW